MVNDPRDTRLTRRGFLSTAAAVGAGALLGGATRAFGQDTDAVDGEGEAPEVPTVPTRPFGASGVDVSMLSVGGTINTLNNQLLLRKALDHGVTYWDTAMGYDHGKIEQGMGQFFAENPEAREKVFLVTKSPARTPAKLSRDLDASLERLQTDHVDLFFVHAVRSPDELTEDLRAWSEKAKESGKIKHFGFSSHREMTACMNRAVELGGIDGIMVTYNFRVMVLDEAMGGDYSAAVDACFEAGIGLTAMKTQGSHMQASDPEAEAKLLDAFTEQGYSAEQARLKAVWADERFSCVCSRMENIQQLLANIAAALDQTELTIEQEVALADYARATCGDYCAGCGEICSKAAGVPVCDVMRYLMYYNAYNDRYEARRLFAELPSDVRRRLTQVDYAAAEARCPQRVPIAQRMKLAQELLA